MVRTLVMSIALLASPAAATEPSGEDRKALLQLAERMDVAWTAGDSDASASLFARDATARFGDDPPGEGRAAIRSQFQSFFKDRPAGLRHLTKIERIEQFTPNLALWDAEVRVERPQAAGGWTTLTRIRNVTLVVRQADGWRIKAVRAFPVQRSSRLP